MLVPGTASRAMISPEGRPSPGPPSIAGVSAAMFSCDDANGMKFDTVQVVDVADDSRVHALVTYISWLMVPWMDGPFTLCPESTRLVPGFRVHVVVVCRLIDVMAVDGAMAVVLVTSPAPLHAGATCSWKALKSTMLASPPAVQLFPWKMFPV